jgi:hypothetical protein
MTHRCSPGYVLAVRPCMLVKGAEMTFRKSAGLADLGQLTGALWTADSGRAVAETELRGPWDVVGRRS